MGIRCVETWFGTLWIRAEAGYVTGLGWGAQDEDGEDPVLDQAVSALDAYAQDPATAFDLPLRVKASAFQQQVCDAMRAIPLGETRSYGDIARALDVTPQAVGQACGANPIPILIPCHRVMGADGKLVGFSGGAGVETKVALLRHERAGGFLL